MAVVLLLVGIWAAVLVPPALRSHAARRQAFLVSFGEGPGHGLAAVPPSTRSEQARRRRRILGGLLVAVVATGLAGLLPTFRVFLVVHLFLLDSFLGYVAVLAHLANRQTGAGVPVVADLPPVAPSAG